MKNHNKILPPYGKYVIRAISNCQITNGINIHCGYRAWDRVAALSRSGCPVLMFPTDESPMDFDWSILKAQECAVIHNPEEPGCIDKDTLNSLCIEIVKGGAQSVGLVDPRFPLRWYIPEQQAA